MRIMKKILLLLGFVLTAIVANAQSFKDAVSGNAPLLKTTSANNTAAPAERVLKAPSKALMHKLSVPKDEKPIFDPEGEDEARLAIGSQGELTTQNGDIFAIYEDAETEDEAGFFGFFYTMEL